MIDQTQIKVPRILVIGVGGSGSRAVAGMVALKPEMNALAIDTDAKALESLAIKQVIQIGDTFTRGHSCGGDVELGRLAIEQDSSNIRAKLQAVGLVVVVAGLGGGAGSGAVPVITRIAREVGTLVLTMVALPFKLEGSKMMRVAETALKRIRTHADAIIRIPNERLYDRADADLPVEQIFARSHEVMMGGIFALSRMLEITGVFSLDFVSIHTLLRNCDGFCHLATAEGAGDARSEVVAEALLNHRLLNKGRVLEGASGIVVGLTGGHDLTLTEIERVMSCLEEKLPNDVWINFGVTIDAEFDGQLSAIALVVEQWKEPLVGNGNTKGPNSNTNLVQGELQLEAGGKGDFSYAEPTIHNNEDLDVPTYIRRDIKLPR